MRRLLSSRRVFEGRRVSVRLDEVEQPSGDRRVYEVVEHPGAVAIVALTAEGQILLVRQFRQPVGAELLEVPAGTIEPGEAPEACARRELVEEVGRAAARWERVVAFYPSPGVLSEELHIFLARDLRAAFAPRDEENLRLEIMPLEDAYERVAAGTIRDAKSIIGITMIRQRLSSPA